MDIETFKQQWQQAASREEAALEGEAIMGMVRQQTSEIRGRVQRRLRREAAIYGWLPVGTAVATIDDPAATQLTILAVVVAMLAALGATLWTAERRMAAAAFDRTLREALRDLADRIDAAAVAWAYASGRAYVDRLFRRDRAELVQCVRQLDEAPADPG